MVVRRGIQALVLCLVVGCGDDAPTRPPDPITDAELLALAEPIIVQIDPVDLAAAPGALPTLTWKVSGKLEGLTVEVRARPPRELAVPAFAALTPGPLMPSLQPVMLATMPAAPAGELTLTLPEPTEGAWAFDVVLRDATEQVIGFDSRVILISSRPALRLAVDRVAAAPTDVIHASVTMAAGARPRAIRVLATRTAPDNSVHTLTADDAAPLFDATSASVKLTVLGGPLAMVGVHRLDVMMFDALTGEALSAARASLTVCDQLTPTTITVREGGAPAGGVAIAFADIATGQTVVSGTSDATGAVTGSLPAGTYSAITDDLTTGDVFTVRGCGAPTIGVGDVAVSARRRRAHGPSFFGGANAARTKLVRHYGVGVPAMTLDDNYLEPIATGIYHEQPQISVVTQKNLAAVANMQMLRMLLGGDEDAARVLEELGGHHALFVFTATKAADSYYLGISVVIVGSGGVRKVEIKVPASVVGSQNTAQVLASVDELLDKLRVELGGSISAYVVDHLQRPLIPLLRLRPLAHDTFAAGTTQMVQVDLVDADSPGIKMENKPVTLVHLGQRVDAMTDVNGTASFTIQIPNTFEPRPVEVYAEFRKHLGPTRSNSQFYTVEGAAGRLRVFTGAARVRPRSTLAIGAEVRKLDGSLESGVPVTFTINLGGLATVVTEVTGVDGLASTSAPVGEGEGLGVIEARIPPDVRSQGYVMVASGAAVRLTTNTLAVLAGVTVSIDGVATREGAPIAGQYVDLSVTGGGSLSASAVVADTHGRFQVDWTAPAGTGIATIHAATTIDGSLTTADQQLAYRPTAPVAFPADTGRWLVKWSSTGSCGQHYEGTALIRAITPSSNPAVYSGEIGFLYGGGGVQLPRAFPSLAGPFTLSDFNDDPARPVETFTQAADFTISGMFVHTLLACGDEEQIRQQTTTCSGARIE